MIGQMVWQVGDMIMTQPILPAMICTYFKGACSHILLQGCCDALLGGWSFNSMLAVNSTHRVC